MLLVFAGRSRMCGVLAAAEKPASKKGQRLAVISICLTRGEA